MTDEAIPAATLIVVREAAGRAPELLMVERAQGMAFAAGALVFPGGRVDEADHLLATRSAIDAHLVAAIRETLEETAIPVGLAPMPDHKSAQLIQDRLIAEQAFGETLAQAGCRIDATQLTPFARWVPKFHAVRRFDTLFFIANAAGMDWQPRVVAGECADAFWLSAQEVLDREQRGEARLIFPTRRTLERLAQHSTFEEILSDARAHPIEPISPWVEERDGEQLITIPAHLGFPVTQERLDGLWRG